MHPQKQGEPQPPCLSRKLQWIVLSQVAGGLSDSYFPLVSSREANYTQGLFYHILMKFGQRKMFVAYQCTQVCQAFVKFEIAFLGIPVFATC